MRRSTDRIIVSHAGTLPRPDDLRESMQAGPAGDEAFSKRLPSAVKEVVLKQVQTGIDIVNDGELGKKGGFSGYVRDRLTGLEVRDVEPGQEPGVRDVTGRDRRQFPGFFATAYRGPAGTQTTGGGGAGVGTGGRQIVFCTGPVSYIGGPTAQEDIANLSAAVAGLDPSISSGEPVEPYLPAIAPGTIEHWLWNEYYKTDEEFLFAIADAMRAEYKNIVDAGFVLQIDDPDLPDGWQMYPDMTVLEYQKYAAVRMEALNHALKDLPEDRIRFHTCWGSQHGPHISDIELRDIHHLITGVHAECISLEAANPRHDHDWQLWEEYKLPDGKSFMPGVISHVSNHIEHPELVAQRLKQYASIMGRENVIAGTDCGIGSRVGHAEIAWAKFDSMVEGARIATRDLWGR